MVLCCVLSALISGGGDSDDDGDDCSVLSHSGLVAAGTPVPYPDVRNSFQQRAK